MSSLNEVEMVIHRPIWRPVLTDSFTFNPQKRWKWLQKAAWWFLHKSGGLKQFVDNELHYEKIVIDRKKAGKALFDGLMELRQAQYKPQQILIGPDDFSQVMGETYDQMRTMNAPFTFNVDMGYNRQLYGLPVTVVPHMKGYLIL